MKKEENGNILNSGTGTKPEPEQDERIRKAFSCNSYEDFELGRVVEFEDAISVATNLLNSRNAEIDALKIDLIRKTNEVERLEFDLNVEKADLADAHRLNGELEKEIEALKSRLMASEGAVKMLDGMDDENQKTIQSLHCCGNCGRSENQRPTDIELCHHCARNMHYHRTPALDNWTPKSKLWKDSTPTEIENDFRKIGGLPPLPEPPCTP